MKQIINKKSYWGQNIFEATLTTINDKEVIRIDVLRSFPSFARKREATYFIENKQQFKQLATDEKCALKFYTGNLNGRHEKKVMCKRTLKSGRVVEEIQSVWIPSIDAFIESFKYDIEK